MKANGAESRVPAAEDEDVVADDRVGDTEGADGERTEVCCEHKVSKADAPKARMRTMEAVLRSVPVVALEPDNVPVVGPADEPFISDAPLALRALLDFTLGEVVAFCAPAAPPKASARDELVGGVAVVTAFNCCHTDALKDPDMLFSLYRSTVVNV